MTNETTKWYVRKAFTLHSPTPTTHGTLHKCGGECRRIFTQTYILVQYQPLHTHALRSRHRDKNDEGKLHPEEYRRARKYESTDESCVILPIEARARSA